MPEPKEPRKLERSTIEFYIGLAVAIVTVVFPMTWWLRCLLLLALVGIVIDVSFRHPRIVGRHVLLKITACLMGVVIIVAVAWKPIREEYRQETATKSPEEPTAGVTQSPTSIASATPAPAHAPERKVPHEHPQAQVRETPKSGVKASNGAEEGSGNFSAAPATQRTDISVDTHITPTKMLAMTERLANVFNQAPREIIVVVTSPIKENQKFADDFNALIIREACRKAARCSIEPPPEDLYQNLDANLSLPQHQGIVIHTPDTPLLLGFSFTHVFSRCFIVNKTSSVPEGIKRLYVGYPTQKLPDFVWFEIGPGSPWLPGGDCVVP